jgi:cytochrome b561
MRRPQRQREPIVQVQRCYGGGARTFHWLTVALLLVIIPMGLVMGDLPRGTLQDTLFITHESLGLTVLALTLARFLWRLGHPPPQPSRDLNRLERMASGGVHVLLYAVLIIMPVTGYLFVTLSDIDLSYFGIVHVPALVAPDKPTGKLFGWIHVSLQWVIYALAAMHIGAALHHHFFRHNDVLARMVPSLRDRAR